MNNTVRNMMLYAEGLACLASAKRKSMLRGYTSPKPYDVSEVEKCVAYDIRVADAWLERLRAYTGMQDPLTGKSVLEIGPGSDLGVGLYLLFRGCACYYACDVHPLAMRAPDLLYENLFARMKAMNGAESVESLRNELVLAKTGSSSRLQYMIREDFDLQASFRQESINLVFSQAAFEHLDDAWKTVSQISHICTRGAVLLAEIDLHTHSPRLRTKDPNNIYRYSDRVFNWFRFRGSVNRIRPYQYKLFFERCGWENVVVEPLLTLPDRRESYSGMNRQFLEEVNQMEYLSILLCARKA